MRLHWNRRDWCRTLIAGATGLGSCRPATGWWRWNGLAFGTEVSIAFAPPLPAEARRLSALCSAEVKRLEAMLSLAEESSAVRRLNREGRLDVPPKELVEILDLCRALHHATAGAFDVTVQPLWELYEDHFRRSPGDRTGPPEAALRQARAKVGFDAVEVGRDQVCFRKPGMALTLNGINQGFVTDRVTDLLRGAGVTSALIDLGEFRAIGTSPEGQPWSIGIRGPAQEPVGTVPLANRALAVSSGSGWTFDPEGRFHHIFHPQSGKVRPQTEVLAVSAPTAAWADGLATAGLVMDPGTFERLIGKLAWPVESWRFGVGPAASAQSASGSSHDPPKVRA